jgi:hypothetical protein
MNAQTFSRLIEISGLPDSERAAVLDSTYSEGVHDWLEVLNLLSHLQVPAPSASRKLAGRVLLLDAVESYHERLASGRRSRFGWLKLVPATVAIGAALTASVAAGAVVTQTQIADRPFSQVLSALGINSGPEDRPNADGDANGSPPANLPVLIPGVDVDMPAPPDSNVQEAPATPGPTGPTENTSGAEPNRGVEPPSHGGANPGQGVGPPRQGGENPGRGVEPPGQSGGESDQGVEPPTQGGETPGQGVEPPAQGGENPGQGVEPSGQGGGNQGQGNKP